MSGRERSAATVPTIATEARVLAPAGHGASIGSGDGGGHADGAQVHALSAAPGHAPPRGSDLHRPLPVHVGGAIGFGPVPYIGFLIPGMVLTSVLITGTGVAIGVAEDGDQGFSDRLRSLPAPRIALPAGRVVGDTVVVAWGTAVTAAMGLLVGFELHGTLVQALLAFGLCVICGFAFTWMFVCMGLVAGNAQAAHGISLLAYPIIFASSAYVRVDTLPELMQPVAEHQPVTVMCNAVRSLALGDPALAGLGHTTTYWVLLSLAWAAGILALFAPLAATLYRRSS